MMATRFPIRISDVVNLLGLERDPKGTSNASSYYVKCPFCNDKKYHMNICEAKDSYRCVRCSGDDKNLGVLDLYGRVRFGTPCTNNNSKMLFMELKGELEGAVPNFTLSHETEVFKDIEPAADESLDKVYTALLKLPYLKLSNEHRENLKRRGLNDKSIAVNGYASVTNPKDWVYKQPRYNAANSVYEARNLGEEKKKYSRIAKTSQLKIVAGMLIANDLERQGYNLSRVPGFFKLAGISCFYLTPGMLIPTRNHLGQIVGLQTRRDNIDKSDLRYVTLSSKSLEGGVTTNISRIHFPKANAALNENSVVCLTEGPLKADITVELIEKPVVFVAVQGVNNTKKLTEIVALLKEYKITKIYNYLDMDKLTNPHVAEAGRKIRKKLKEKGIELNNIFWDENYARRKEQNMKALCVLKSIDWRETGRVITNLGTNCVNLYNHDIDCNTVIRDGKEIIEDAWDSRTKGIDDYLLFLRNQD